MKLAELFEVKHRASIDIELGQELFEKNCKDMDLKRPCWRGSKSAAEKVYVIQGEQGSRKSANISNHYTVLLDQFLPKLGYPKRSASIIFSNYAGYNYARGYRGYKGALYAIFPFDNVPIGMCSEEDIWHLRFKLGYGPKATMEVWNYFFDDAGVPDHSYSALVKGIQDILDDPEDKNYSSIYKIFRDDPDDVENILKETYGDPQDLGVSLVTTADLPVDNVVRELWAGGKCLAIREDIWEQLSGHRHEDKKVEEAE